MVSASFKPNCTKDGQTGNNRNLKAVTPAGEDGTALDCDDVGPFRRLQQVEVHETLHPAKQNVGDLVQKT